MGTDFTKTKMKDKYERILTKNGVVKKIVVAVHLPTGAIELIFNSDDIENKFNAYMTAYDEDMHLNTNKSIYIIDCMIL